MSLTARLAASALGVGVLFTGAGSALAAPADDVAPAAPAATGLTPYPGGTPLQVIEGAAVPLDDPTLGVPKVLEVGVLPLGLLADAAGESGSTATGNGAENAPGSSTS